MVCAFREAGYAFNIPDLTVEDLIQNQGKWHKNCRREFRRDRFDRLNKKGTTSQSVPEPIMTAPSVSSSATRLSKDSGKESQSICLFYSEPTTEKKKLHKFQKVISN